MAYNPFDDVIENDPAYMQTGGELQRSILPQRRVNYVDDGQSERMADIARGPVNFLGDLFAQTMGRIAENMVNPEAAERGRQKNEINKEIANYFGVVPQQITPAMNQEYFEKFGKEYQQLNFEEGINSGFNFLLEDAIKGSQAIQSGEKRFTDLPGNQKLGVGLLPLEFWLGGFGRKAAQGVGNEVLSKYKDMPLAELVTNPQARQEIPEIVAEVENQYPILRKQTGPRETTERPSDMDLVASQSDSLDNRGLRFKTGMPNKSTLDARTKIDNFLNKLDSKQTTTAPEIAKETGVPYTQVDSLVRSFNYKNNPQIVKAQAGDAPLFLKNYKLKNDPKGELPAVATYLRDMSSSFNKKFGKNPTSPELQLFIKQTETNPEIVEYFSKTPLARMQGFKASKDQIGVSAAQKAPIKNIVQEEISKNTPEGIQFKNALDLTEQQLKQTTAKQNEFSLAFDRNKNVFEPIFGSGKSGKSNYRRYMQNERGVEPRMDRLDEPGSPIPQQSAKKIQRAEQQLNFMLESKPNAIKNQKYGTGIDRSTPMFRFLTQKYRGMIDEKGNFLNPEKFMESYVMPYKGNTSEETISNLAKEYNKKIDAEDIAEFDEFLKVDQKYLRLRDLKESLMDELELSGKYTDEQLEQINLSIRPNFGHAYPIKKTQSRDRLEGLSSDPRFLRAVPAVYNVSYQNTYDNTLQKVIDEVSKIKKVDELKVKKPKIITPEKNLEKVGVSINSKDFDNQLDYLTALTEKINQAMIDKGLISILAQSKKSNNVLDVMKNAYSDKDMAYFFGGPEKSPEEYMKMIRENLLEMGPDLKYVKENITGRVGGKRAKPMVRMAMGGDPLQNINQQQFSPDPAVDQDYFQEAVDSGNLQAANLFNLFKVFNKPKAMATPSNVKKVEEARDPIPAPTGSQEIAPLPAGRQDFFFKSFFLDQLNSQNAPKASTPQGWREFLIKGRKVPEAEMMDTGILQYLEDTEKFFPNKKITKQDLETLYDTSPLGNLEVRVKEIKAPGFDEGQFTLDQGRPRHKGAGNAAIDQAADDYFEVVVNVPQLPGQEKVFVNSGHFSEPNVLGFTRVGTYKNADNQTVAVIQEMQTDMLTEVRKEQERLFAMVNALKRQRANLVNQVEQSRGLAPGNVDYATNKLRQFDQKYPESLLNDLAQDNLIQPFPNIVAKELIPEKTRNLNAIQDDINKLSMANVEQYTDPAYKTKIFDLAQEQTKILDDLMSMNRSSNYQEKLKDFKVPSTSNREELQRIGEVDTYLPSDYNMKKLESFPPIPFNKQADYVDLLIKSTIKAAKQKGIDRVAIMPADIGANPRWGKSSDEAKKKFQNLYDKVGVQQLKNIAKKYDGTLNVEKIIDPSKTNRGLTFLNKSPDGEFQFLKQTETKKNVSDAERDAFYDTEITRIASGVNEPGTIVLTREIAPGQMMDYYLVEGRGDATDVGYRMIPLKENENADDALIKIVEYNPSAIDMYTISFDPSKLEEPMYLFKKKSGGTIDKDSLVSITDIYGEYGR
jgi:hypothetical protein